MNSTGDSSINAMEKGEAGLTREKGGVASPPLSAARTGTVKPVLSKSTTLCSSPGESITHQSRFVPLSLFSKKADRGLPKSLPRLRRQKKYRVPVKTRRINDHAKGYPNLGAFLDSAEGFALYRRFGYLQSRVLLHKQEKLRGLEDDLQLIELEIANEDEDALCYSKLHGPHAAKHGQIMNDIETVLCSYAQMLATAQKMMSFSKPSESEYQSVGKFLNNRKSLGVKEATWIQHKEDIITLSTGKDHAWLDDFVEGLLKLCHCPPIDWIFQSKETRKKTEIDGPNMPGRPPQNENKYELFYTPSRISKLANCILMIFVLVLLVLPIYLLYHLVHDVGTQDSYLLCIATLLVFTLAFSSILSLFTKARRHEILAAAAAYCAVLVVFLGNVVPSVI